jgi:hypothetical protein
LSVTVDVLVTPQSLPLLTTTSLTLSSAELSAE